VQSEKRRGNYNGGDNIDGRSYGSHWIGCTAPVVEANGPKVGR
jgi:hypothetical protein